jgi:TatD DNase family protein
MLIDIHTHKPSQYKSIKSLHFPNEYENLSDASTAISIGIHPWWAEVEHSEKFEKLFEQGVPPSVVAIGECGIDRVRGAAIEVQKTIFHRQVQLASTFNLPVIVHQVKGISDVLHEIKQFPYTVFVFHGYLGNPEQTLQLLKHNVFFSFGEGSYSEVLSQSRFSCRTWWCWRIRSRTNCQGRHRKTHHCRCRYRRTIEHKSANACFAFYSGTIQSANYETAPHRY